MYETDGGLDREHDLELAVDHDWIRSLLAAGAGRAVISSVSREQVLAAGRARLARHRLSAGAAALAVAAVVAATGYAISGAGVHDGHGTVTASTAPSLRQEPVIDTAVRIGSSPTPSAS
jgi:hypothetical protein